MALVLPSPEIIKNIDYWQFRLKSVYFDQKDERNEEIWPGLRVHGPLPPARALAAAMSLADRPDRRRPSGASAERPALGGEDSKTKREMLRDLVSTIVFGLRETKVGREKSLSRRGPRRSAAGRRS